MSITFSFARPGKNGAAGAVACNTINSMAHRASSSPVTMLALAAMRSNRDDPRKIQFARALYDKENNLIIMTFKVGSKFEAVQYSEGTAIMDDMTVTIGTDCYEFKI
jgi:hypothetical protein